MDQVAAPALLLDKKIVSKIINEGTVHPNYISGALRNQVEREYVTQPVGV